MTELFDLLADTHRRRVLLLLCQTDSIRVPEGLRTRGAARTHGGRSTHRPEDEERSQSTHAGAAGPDETPLGLELLHCHLPKLEADGVVEWDREARTVSRGPEFERIEPALRVLLENADKFPDTLL